ncbi:recombinase RecX [Lentibacillus amyloliquefaciens]|uniref:Regulatory protein RecX n=2 Tax=Lentibacillus amyloliquefaciens TaxID=1472767 RepID=A0A0U3WGG9_9BACI|nr:recombination regulator RecX [Lentibacillus amyloliquefaciens]ALX48959.1 recombinase RecX [Lentibacillus amyloliquefaciens]
MPKITRITTQKKHKDRYNIFLDDGGGEKYGFSVDESILVEYRLRKQMELDDSTVTVLIQKDTLHKHYTLAINYLSYRMRTKKEMRDYLVQKEVDEEHISQIMKKLNEEGLTDDREFARSFVRTRMNTSSKGPILVRQELLQKGVAEELASEAVAIYSFDVQFEKALKLAEKNLRSNSKKSFRQQVQKMQGTLMQKGFTGDVVKEVTSELQNQKDDDAEWEALVKQGEKLLHKHRQKYSGFQLSQKVKEALYRKGFTIDLINTFLDEYMEQ